MAIDDYIDKRCFVPARSGPCLTSAQAEEYNENGWLLLRGHVPRQTIDDLRPRVVAAFVALTPSTLENGCIYCIPGTHKLGRIYHTPHEDEFGLQNLVCDISSFRGPVALELEPGDVAFVPTLTVHASFENRCEARRINLGFHRQHEQTNAKCLAPYRKKKAAAHAAPETVP